MVITQKENRLKLSGRFHSHLLSRTEQTEKKTGCATHGCLLVSYMFWKEANSMWIAAFEIYGTTSNTSGNSDAVQMQTWKIYKIS